MPFDPNRCLYLTDAASHSIGETPQLLEKLAASGKPIVLHIHGRGDEPDKSLVQKRTVARLEKEFAVAVLFFNWDSKPKSGDGLKVYDRVGPLKGAAAAAADLGTVFSHCAAFRSAHPQTPLTVHVHSMGSIAVQRLVEANSFTFASGQFSGFLFTEPDADESGHTQWLGTVAANGNVFVTLNSSDKVLKHSKEARPPGTHALGLGLPASTAPGVTYLDLSGLVGRAHKVFSKGAMNHQVHVAETVQTILRGGTPKFTIGGNVRRISPDGRTVSLSDLQNPKHPVFSAPDLDDDDGE